MIHEVQGDILLSRASAIAHGVAPNDHFEQGLALALRERHPDMYQEFRRNYHVNHPDCGEIAHWEGPGTHIIHLFTQEKAPERAHGHAGKATLVYVHKALRNLARHIEKEKLPSLAISRLATGVGGLSWAEVKPEIEAQLGKLECRVNVYSTYVAGQAAEEAL